MWAERIKGIKAAYVDSCTRLGSALEELEQTLCLLTGTPAAAKLGLGIGLRADNDRVAGDTCEMMRLHP